MRSVVVFSLVLSLGAGCIVTRAPRLDERPRWMVDGDDGYDAGCVIGRAFVRKSGKTGFGVALQLKSRGDCRFEIASAQLVWKRGGAVAIPAITPVDLPGRSVVYAWLPVAFDNNAAWNAGRDDATLELAVAVAGQPARPWRIAVRQDRREAKLR